MFEYKALAPNFRLLDNFKKKKISEEKKIKVIGFANQHDELKYFVDSRNLLFNCSSEKAS